MILIRTRLSRSFPLPRSQWTSTPSPSSLPALPEWARPPATGRRPLPPASDRPPSRARSVRAPSPLPSSRARACGQDLSPRSARRGVNPRRPTPPSSRPTARPRPAAPLLLLRRAYRPSRERARGRVPVQAECGTKRASECRGNREGGGGGRGRPRRAAAAAAASAVQHRRSAAAHWAARHALRSAAVAREAQGVGRRVEAPSAGSESAGRQNRRRRRRRLARERRGKSAHSRGIAEDRAVVRRPVRNPAQTPPPTDTGEAGVKEVGGGCRGVFLDNEQTEDFRLRSETAPILGLPGRGRG